MRFGLDLHRHRVPEWEPRYINYDLLKKKFNLATKNGNWTKAASDIDLYTSIDTQLDLFNDFHTQQHELLVGNVASLRERCRLQGISSDHSSVILGRTPENEQLIQTIKEVQHLHRKLSWYATVNDRAILRIFDKLARLEEPDHSEETRLRQKSSSFQLIRDSKGSDRAVEIDQLVKTVLDVYEHELSTPATNSVHSDSQNDSIRATKPVSLNLFRDTKADSSGEIQAKDTHGRSPLFYAARQGAITPCLKLLKQLAGTDATKCDAQDAILSSDHYSESPLRVAVIRNHVSIVKLFFELLGDDFGPSDQFDELLIIALRYKYDDMVQLLLSHVLTKNGRSARGETPLYVASQMGNATYVKMILAVRENQCSNVDCAENIYNWTPLCVASVNGHIAVVKLLLEAGANCDSTDYRGWYIKEHASYRGHVEMAEILTMPTKSHMEALAIGSTTNLVSDGWTPLSSSRTTIIVNLGSLQIGRGVTAIDLKCCSQVFDGVSVPDTNYFIDVSASESSKEVSRVHLPVLDDMSNRPFVFSIASCDEPKLTFKVFRQEFQNEVFIGSGTALLERSGHLLDEKRESLVRELTVPIMEVRTFDFLGTVTFTFVISKPYVRLNTADEGHYDFDSHPVELIGHRGRGQNTGSREYLQLGENTLESFRSAQTLGALFVEFDLQMTRDLVPVVYHDFSLSECGTDVPIHDLSFEQFIHASEIQSPTGELVSQILNDEVKSNKTRKNRLRTRSMIWKAEREAFAIQNRMKHTFDYKDKGFKPNTRGDFIQGTFATLEELLVLLPENIKFDIEVKYPRIHEAVDAGVAPVGLNINIFIDNVLDKLHHLGGNRTIILSSFNPDICILMALKQRKYQVMYITNAGKPPFKDRELRAASVQAALRFARKWNLAGTVFASEPLIQSPRLVGYAKRSGKACASYGPLNNIPHHAMSQINAGINLITVDRVALISKLLKDNPAKV